MTHNVKISKKEFSALLGTDISDIVYNNIVVVLYERDEEGNRIMVGPSFAHKPKVAEYTIQLVEPGRPVGTTIANGASPKTPRKRVSDK